MSKCLFSQILLIHHIFSMGGFRLQLRAFILIVLVFLELLFQVAYDLILFIHNLISWLILQLV